MKACRWPALVALAGCALGLGSVRAQVATPDCKALRSAYAAALTQAQRCDAGAPTSCSALRPRALEDACRCAVAVKPASTAELDRLAAQHQAQNCSPEPLFCNRACPTPAAATRSGSAAPPRPGSAG